jgi:GPI-GlcNAc transferase complex PIG-U subunit
MVLSYLDSTLLHHGRAVEARGAGSCSELICCSSPDSGLAAKRGRSDPPSGSRIEHDIAATLDNPSDHAVHSATQPGTMTLAGKAGLFSAAAALRLALFVVFPSLPDLLTGRVEISTPVTSFKRRKLRRLVRLEQFGAMLIPSQCRKDYSSTTTTFLRTMEVFTTRRLFSCRSSPSFPTRGCTPSSLLSST